MSSIGRTRSHDTPLYLLVIAAGTRREGSGGGDAVPAAATACAAAAAGAGCCGTCAMAGYASAPPGAGHCVCPAWKAGGGASSGAPLLGCDPAALLRSVMQRRGGAGNEKNCARAGLRRRW